MRFRTLLGIGLAASFFFQPSFADGNDVNDSAKRKKLIEQFDSLIDQDSLVEKIAVYHYKQPEESEVRLHMQNLTELKSYLHQLDNYSSHISPEKIAFSIARNTLPRIGIGLDIIEHDGKLLAIPIEKEALYQAGFKVPQYLKSIQGKAVSFEDFNSYKQLADMKASRRYSVELVKNKFSDKKTFKVAAKLTRRKLHYRYKNKELSVIGIREFSLDTRRYLSSFFKANHSTEHLVLDLRYCIGGSPGFAVDALSFFIGKEKKVATYHSAEEDKVFETVAAPYKLKKSSKLTILTSEFTASSSEFFVHALKHYHSDVTIIGKPSAGKCLAQKPYFLEDGSVLKLSIYELITADGSRCEGKPIQVDKRIEDIELMQLKRVLKEL